MALLTDDQDIRESYLFIEVGGNGDYYVNTVEYFRGLPVRQSVRVATSGGNAPTDVMLAVATLYQAMEAAGLNSFPETKALQQKGWENG